MDTLGCFVNSHMNSCDSNGIIAKINKYYVSITLGLLQLMLSNDLCFWLHIFRKFSI